MTAKELAEYIDKKADHLVARIYVEGDEMDQETISYEDHNLIVEALKAFAKQSE